LGGIGTGTVSLGGRGELRDWEVANKPAKKYSTTQIGNDAPFFSIFVNQPSTSTKITKALLGPVHPTEHLNYEGRPCNHHGLPRFRQASFDAAYPFGIVNLSDSNMPVSVILNIPVFLLKKTIFFRSKFVLKVLIHSFQLIRDQVEFQ
jgi:hypothetical protein